MTRNLVMLIVGLWMGLPNFAHSSHALLIGIQDYSTGLHPLKGSRNDVELMSETLQEILLIPKDNITRLMDGGDREKGIKPATHTEIRQAFYALSQKIQENDFIYIHYSGHGSLIPDLDGNEESGYDQTWVPYDARTGKLNGIDDFDIVDDEINAWLQPIFDKTENVVFVSDSCHSGTITRSDQTVRTLFPDDRPHPALKQDALPVQGIRIGAAKDDKKAYEGTFEGKKQGVFTWYWAQALKTVFRDSNWEVVFQKAAALTTAYKDNRQQPHWAQNSVLSHPAHPLEVIVLPQSPKVAAIAEKVRQLLSEGEMKKLGYTLASSQAALKIRITETHLLVNDANDRLIHPYLRIPLADDALKRLRYNLAIYARAYLIKRLSFPFPDEENAAHLNFRLLPLDRDNSCENSKEINSWNFQTILAQVGKNMPCIKLPYNNYENKIFHLSPSFTKQVTLAAQSGDEVILRLDNSSTESAYHYYLVRIYHDDRVGADYLGQIEPNSKQLSFVTISLSTANDEIWKLIVSTEKINIANYQQEGFQKKVPESPLSGLPKKRGGWYVRTYQVRVSD
jgi:hypothetical protein